MSDYSINKQVNGNYVIMDDSEDAPLITIQFHNDAARVPEEAKIALIRQMFDPMKPELWVVGCWWFLGAIMSAGGILLGYLIRRWTGL